MAKAIIDPDRCKGCLLFTAACPRKLIAPAKTLNSKGYHPAAIADESQCIGCALCARMCPDCAITVEK